MGVCVLGALCCLYHQIYDLGIIFSVLGVNDFSFRQPKLFSSLRFLILDLLDRSEGLIELRTSSYDTRARLAFVQIVCDFATSCGQ